MNFDIPQFLYKIQFHWRIQSPKWHFVGYRGNGVALVKWGSRGRSPRKLWDLEHFQRTKCTMRKLSCLSELKLWCFVVHRNGRKKENGVNFCRQIWSLVGKCISVQKKMVGRKTTFRLLSEFFFVGKFAVQEFRIRRKKRPEEGKQSRLLSGNLIPCRIHRFKYVRKNCREKNDI